MTAHVNERGIVFRGHTPQDQPPAWWESLLDELKAHHVPGLHPHGRRMISDVGAEGVAHLKVLFYAVAFVMALVKLVLTLIG